MGENKKDVLISVRGLKTYYPIRKGIFRRIAGYVRAVDDVSFDVYRGEVLGVVGESGCGKTTMGKSILRLIPAHDGQVLYNFPDGEKDVLKMNKAEMDEARRKMQIVFQNPYSSLNPAYTIFGTMQEPLIHFGMKSKAERKAKIAQLLKDVNLSEDYMQRYPNEFSGGSGVCCLRRGGFRPGRVHSGPGTAASEGTEGKEKPYLYVHHP